MFEIHPPLDLLCPAAAHPAIDCRTREARRSACTRAGTLALDATFRALRASPMMLERAPTVAPAAVPGQKRRTIYCAGNQQLLPGAVVRPSRPRRRPRPTARSRGLRRAWRDLRFLLGGIRSPLDRRRRHGARCDRPLRRQLRQRVLERPADGLRRRRRRALQPVHEPLDVIGHELDHGVTEDEAGLLHVPARRAQRVVSDVLGSLIKQRVHEPDRGEADWLIGAGLSRRRSTGGPAIDEGAGHRVRRPDARQGSAAGSHGRLSCETFTTTAACTSTPAFRTRRSTWRPQPWAGTRGRKRDGSGTRRCGIQVCARTPGSAGSPI